MRHPAWRFEWRTSWDDVWAPTFVAEWQRLIAADAGALPYHQPGLVRAWSETLGAACAVEPRIGIARSADGAVLLLPWVIEHSRGRLITRRRLLPAGAGVFGYGRPVITGAPPAWPAFWPALAHNLAGDVDLVDVAFVEPEIAGGISAAPAGDPCPVLDLATTTSLDELLARCSPNHRTDVRRRFRRLQEAGLPRFDLAGARTRPAAEALVSEVLAAYEEHFPPSGGRGLLLWPNLREFLIRIVSDGVAEGWGQLAILSLDDQPLAWHIGFAAPRDWLWWMPVYREAAAAWAPGKVLLARWLEAALQQRIARCHLQAGGQPYKMAWRPAVPDLVSIRMYGGSLRGRVLRLYDSSAAHARG